jgi:hypothetical protein
VIISLLFPPKTRSQAIGGKHWAKDELPKSIKKTHKMMFFMIIFICKTHGPSKPDKHQRAMRSMMQISYFVLVLV